MIPITFVSKRVAPSLFIILCGFAANTYAQKPRVPPRGHIVPSIALDILYGMI